MTREERQQERENRRAETKRRRRESYERQLDSNAQVYGAGSRLEEYANERTARIYGIDTTKPREEDNKQGTNERLANDGIDELGGDTSGVPSGYVEKAGVIVENGTRVAGSILFKES